MTYPYQPGPPDPTQPTPPPPDPQVPPYGVPAYYQPQPYQPQPYEPQPYQPPPQPYQPYQQYPYQPYPYQQPRRTEGLAIASLVLSCAAVLGFCTYGIGALLGIVGAILGHVARRRIARDGSEGAGMALAGIIVGWLMVGLATAFVALIAVLAVNDPSFME